MEDLSDASFLGKLLVLPANVRLDWKVIARYKHSSLLGLIISNEEKMFYNTDTRALVGLPMGGAPLISQRPKRGPSMMAATKAIVENLSLS